MITLTTAQQIESVLGSAATTAYDKAVLSPINFNPVSGLIAANVRLTSTSDANAQPIIGTLNITLSTGELVLTLGPITTRKILTAGQITSAQAIITSAQNQIETGLVNLGVVVGTQSAGV